MYPAEYLHARRTYFRSHHDQAWPFVRRWLLTLDKHEPVLDVGCGGGDDLRDYAALGFERLYGIDPAASMVHQSKTLLGGRARVQAGAWEDMPCPAEFFAGIIGRYSLHYLRALEPAFMEAHRSLKAAGLLIFVVSNPAFDAVSRCRITIEGHTCIRATVYDRSFEITYYCHTLGDYLSQTFLDRFTLVDLLEFTTAIDDQECVPSGLAIAARKR